MNSFSLYTFGSMSLGHNPADIANDLAVARRAMDAGVWFHSSPTYNQGFTFMVLRHAFDADRAHRPRLILKVRDGSPSLMRFEVEDSCRRLGIDAIDVAQLVSMSPDLVEQLRGDGGALADELASLRQRGLIKKAVIYIHPSNADAAVEAVQKSKLAEGITLYWNACQNESTASAWEKIRSHRIPVLALRTLGGGLKDQQSAAKDARHQELVQEAGCRNASEFALRLAASEEPIRTTIGGTSSLAHLEDFLEAAKAASPLAPGLKEKTERLQRE